MPGVGSVSSPRLRAGPAPVARNTRSRDALDALEAHGGEFRNQRSSRVHPDHARAPVVVTWWSVDDKVSGALSRLNCDHVRHRRLTDLKRRVYGRHELELRRYFLARLYAPGRLQRNGAALDRGAQRII